MMLDISNVFSAKAPLYLRLLGGLAAGLIGGSIPLFIIVPPQMIIGTGMLLCGMLVLFWAMYLGMRAQK